MTRRWVGALLAPLVAGWLLAASGALHAQQTPPETPTATAVTSAAATPAAAFDVDIRAPDDIRAYLLRHLDLMRYRELGDLDDTELERLRIAADANVRELLGTLGYFSPQVEITQSAAPADAKTPRRVVVAVQAGVATLVETVSLEFAGAIADDAAAARQRAQIRGGWKMPPGTPFTQARWDDAKTQALRLLGATRYPAGRIAASRAAIDPQTHAARLSLTLDSGPAYRFGPLQVTGLQRYDAQLVARIARIRPGAEYSLSGLLEAQQRLQDSGYFDSAYVELDPSADPAAAPVLVTLREAKRNKLTLGVGVSTDSGPRLSVEHTNHQMPLLGWRAASRLLLDRETQSIGSDLSAPPDDAGWRWVVSGLVKNENAADVEVRSLMLRGGRAQLGDRIDRNYHLQYDRAATAGQGLETTAQSISVNYAWTQRNFDSLPFPASGYGLGVELGGGWTLGNSRQPYLRTRANWIGIWSPAGDGQTAARAGRLSLRAQAGAVVARDGIALPSTQLFLTGGDATVRGYAFNSIGSTDANGVAAPGRYLASGSIQWQRPILVDGRPSDWESALFIDAGAVADKPSALRAKVGVGAGVLYRSPVGPLQIDLAYGVATRRLRLHLSVGFTF